MYLRQYSWSLRYTLNFWNVKRYFPNNNREIYCTIIR